VNALPPHPPQASTPPNPRFDPRCEATRFLSQDVPGIGGILRARAEDFFVEELPAYTPSGQGEHLYLMLQKVGLSTMQMVGIVARHFRVPIGAVGIAGLKDKHAVTRQVVSVHVPGRKPEDFPALRHPRIDVVWMDLHTNKLRRGHLKGNRFSIRVRNVEPTRVVYAKRTLERLLDLGIPNRFGTQRFGRAGNNHLIGRSIIVGDDSAAVQELLAPATDTRPEHQAGRELFLAGRYAQAADLLPEGAEAESCVLRALAQGRTPAQAIRAMPHTARSFFLSSFQSAVFNAVLDARLEQGTWNALLPGDLAFKHENGAVFAIDDGTLALPDTATRLAAHAISPTGPMWGLAMPRATLAPGDLDLEALVLAGVSPDDFERLARGTGEQLKGERRALRIDLGLPTVEGGADEHGHYIRCAFDLPAGAFATVVMQEVMKASPSATGE
jgi:tRNA pseudouridine13 synthase